jgi:hypothetical protein
MTEWIDELADALGQERLPEPDVRRLLGAARDVAHRVERRVTPLAAFLLGSAVGAGLERGERRDEALDGALRTLEGALPPPGTSEPRAGSG